MAVGAFLLLLALPAGAQSYQDETVVQSHARIVRLSYLSGDVQLDRGQGNGYERALLNMPLGEGMKLWTRDSGEAEVEFEEGSTVRLAPGTYLEFTQLGLSANGGKITAVTMDEGTAYFDVVHPERGSFILSLPRRDITLERSVRFRAQVERDSAQLAVYKGELNISSDGRTVTVRKNDAITLDFSDPARYVLADVIQPGPYDAWNGDRERFRTQYTTASANYSGYPQYGWADMSYYGSSSYIPGWGYVWRPTGAGLGFDPWSGGAWSWYPGAGYCWVSGYQWGWLPYHYGSWAFIPGYGWGWLPGGSSWNGWSPVSPITNPPNGFVGPTPPRPPTGGPPATLVLTGSGGGRPPGLKRPPIGDGPGDATGRRGSDGGVTPGMNLGGSSSSRVVITPDGTNDDSSRGPRERHTGGGPGMRQLPSTEGGSTPGVNLGGSTSSRVVVTGDDSSNVGNNAGPRERHTGGGPGMRQSPNSEGGGSSRPAPVQRQHESSPSAAPAYHPAPSSGGMSGGGAASAPAPSVHMGGGGGGGNSGGGGASHSDGGSHGRPPR